MRSIPDRHWGFFDALVLAVAVAAELEIALGDIAGPRWMLVAAVPLYTLPLLCRERWPLTAPLFVIAVQVATSFIDVPGGVREDAGVVAYVFAFWAVAANNPLRTAVAGLGVGVAGVVVVTLEDVRVVAEESWSVALIGALTWLAGAALRQRTIKVEAAERRAAALERDHREASAAVAAERARIARELHDVVAHCVSVMTVQAGAARMVLGSDPQRAVAPLLAVEETGRQALGELRRLLGLLRAEATETGLVPQPGLEDLPALVETVRRAGLSVELSTEGTVRGLAPGLSLTAYRIVQEALTNTLKHAEAGQVWVRIGYDVTHVTIEVRDNGRGSVLERARHNGHGIAGMRERAAIYGGVLEAGPDPDGGYAVRGRLPIEGTPS